MVSIDAFSLESHWVRPVCGRMWCLNREEAGNPKREKRERRERENPVTIADSVYYLTTILQCHMTLNYDNTRSNNYS